VHACFGEVNHLELVIEMTSDSSGEFPERGNSSRWQQIASDAEAIEADDPRRIKAALAMFERLSRHWNLSEDDRTILLGGISSATFHRWIERPDSASLTADTRERIANLYAIDLNAHSLFASEFADQWVRQSNEAFNGRSALARMLDGGIEDIISVRQYLDRARWSAPQTADDIRAEPISLSLLPGEAVDDAARVPALRQAVEIYQNLSRHDPARYRFPLSATMTALADALQKDSADEANFMFQEAVSLAYDASAQNDMIEVLLRQAIDTPDRTWTTVILPEAVHDIIRIAMLDPQFNRALLDQLRLIERDPFVFAADSKHEGLHTANFVYRTVTWSMRFFLTSTSRTVMVVSIALESSQ
jgi:hypothetical protein